MSIPQFEEREAGEETALRHRYAAINTAEGHLHHVREILSHADALLLGARQ